MNKIIRVATHSGSLAILLKGQLHFMSHYFDVVAIGSEGDKHKGLTSLERLKTEEGVGVIPVEMTREITPIQDLRALYLLYKIFRAERPDIVHSHTPKAGTLAMIAAKLAGVPHRLHTVAGLPLVEAVGPKRILLNIVEKITYACATKVYPNSYGLLDIINNGKFTNPQKLKVIGKGSSNGIDTTLFNPEIFTDEQRAHLREKLEIKKNRFVYIFLGRIVRDKGINELVQAFKRVQQEHQEAMLLLVGYYDKQIAQLEPDTDREIETNKHIVLVGWQEDVRPYLSIANVLTFPSYREGFPNVVMQASAMQLPSIVTDINGCNEIIEEGVNGTIIPVKNREALQKSMSRLLVDKALYKKMVQNARTSISYKYEQEYIWNSLLQEYKTLLDSSDYSYTTKG